MILWTQHIELDKLHMLEHDHITLHITSLFSNLAPSDAITTPPMQTIITIFIEAMAHSVAAFHCFRALTACPIVRRRGFDHSCVVHAERTDGQSKSYESNLLLSLQISAATASFGRRNFCRHIGT